MKVFKNPKSEIYRAVIIRDKYAYVLKFALGAKGTVVYSSLKVQKGVDPALIVKKNNWNTTIPVDIDLPRMLVDIDPFVYGMFRFFSTVRPDDPEGRIADLVKLVILHLGE